MCCPRVVPIGQHGPIEGTDSTDDRAAQVDRDALAGVVLAAGAGTRLRPLTDERPKALCPVADRPLVDHALDRVEPWTGSVAVNLHHRADLIDAHLGAAVHRSFERPRALGTAGALGALRSWIDGRHVLLTNADAWFPPGLDLAGFVAGHDGERTRLLCVGEEQPADFGTLRYCGIALLPWATVAGFVAEPSGLYEVSWGAEHRAGRLDLVVHDGGFVDCGRVGDYLDANLRASGGASVVSAGAVVEPGARMERTVVWDGARVAGGEHLRDAIRTRRGTVLVR